jgi:hypothetical protein
MQHPTRSASAVLAIAFGCAASSAFAQGAPADPWQFRATIYAYFPSISASTVFPPPANGGTSIGLDASDYLRALEFAFMGSFEARKGQWGLLTDYIYLNFSADKSATRDFTLTGPLGQVSLPADVTGSVDLSLRGWAWLLAGTYTAIERPDHEMQVLGGLRYLKFSSDVNWRLSGNVGSVPIDGRQGSASIRPDYWDGIVGIRGRARLGADGKWFLPYYADIGTGDSDLTWQAMAGLGYSFSWGEVTAVYRHLEYDFGSSGALRDLSFSGPAIAASWRW